MATINSSVITRLYVAGAGARVALFYISSASTSDTADLSTTFSNITNACFVHPGLTASASTMASVAPASVNWTGFVGGGSTFASWVFVEGIGA